MSSNFPTSIDSFTNKVDNFDEVMAADVNNLQDAILAVETALYSGDGWMGFSPTLTYASFSGIIGTFTIAGDYTAIFRRKRPLKLVQNSTTKYFYVVSSSYSDPDTTVTITGGDLNTLTNDAISGVKIGISENPLGFPWLGGWIFLSTYIGSTNWDGDPRSTTSKTLIDMSSEFGLPGGIKAIIAAVTVRDLASTSSNTYLTLAPNDSNNIGFSTKGDPSVNDRTADLSHTIPCNIDGDIYFQVSASGVGTFDAWLRIWGFQL